MRNFVCLGFLWLSFCFAEAKVAVYPRVVDKAITDSERYEVYVRDLESGGDWQALQVFAMEVDMDTRSKAAFAQFDMDAPVEVKVVAAEEAAPQPPKRDTDISAVGVQRIDLPQETGAWEARTDYA